MDECFIDKNLLFISLSKFHKLNKRRQRVFLIAQFKSKQKIKAWFLISKTIFAWTFQHILSLSSTSFLIYSCFRTIFLTRSQNNVLWIVCVEQLKIVCFYMFTFICNVVTLIFCVSRIGAKENVDLPM